MGMSRSIQFTVTVSGSPSPTATIDVSLLETAILQPQIIPAPQSRQSAQQASLGELAGLFLKLGCIAFGGPPAHIAMMDEEVVVRRHWLTREEFLDFLGATNLIPGPNSTEMAIHVGRVQAGFPGLVVAGGCFILPASILVTLLAWVYVRYGSLPQVGGMLYGVKPVVIALIIQAIIKLGRTALKSAWIGVIGLVAAIAVAMNAGSFSVLAGAGVFAGLAFWVRHPRSRDAKTTTFVGSALTFPGMAASFSLTSLFLVFLKIGSILFGGGYVLVALIRSELVTRLHWISERQLLDAMAMGQATPGPISTAATFIGYLLAGIPGAMIATVAMFLPAFFFVAISGPLVPKLRRSPLAGVILDGVNVAALALMAVVTWPLFASAVIDWITLFITAISLYWLLRGCVNAMWLVLGGAITGLVRLWLGAWI
jgi:chromate transporter